MGNYEKIATEAVLRGLDYAQTWSDCGRTPPKDCPNNIEEILNCFAATVRVVERLRVLRHIEKLLRVIKDLADGVSRYRKLSECCQLGAEQFFYGDAGRFQISGPPPGLRKLAASTLRERILPRQAETVVKRTLPLWAVLDDIHRSRVRGGDGSYISTLAYLAGVHKDPNAKEAVELLGALHAAGQLSPGDVLKLKPQLVAAATCLRRVVRQEMDDLMKGVLREAGVLNGNGTAVTFARGFRTDKWLDIAKGAWG